MVEHAAGPRPRERGPSGPVGQPAFLRFWISDACSVFGSFVSGFALQVLVLQSLGGVDLVGWLRAAQWGPMVVFGLLAGALLDRWRRRGVLVVAETVAGLTMAAVAVTALTGVLSVPLLLAAVFVMGTAGVFSSVAQQSLLPDLVPPRLLLPANARIEQTYTSAQTLGPVIAGALVQAISAAGAVAVDAVARFASAAFALSIGDVEGRRVPTGSVSPGSVETERGALVAEPSTAARIVEGVRWVYGHPMLRWYAITLHVWFWGSAAVGTVLVAFLIGDLQLSVALAGVVVAVAGVTAVVGSQLSGVAERRWGAGPVYVVADWLTPIGWALVALAGAGAWSTPGAIALAVAGQAVSGFGLGAKGPVESSYRTAVTPVRLRGRMNATIRSVNWGSLAVISPLAGLVAVAVGETAVIAVATGVAAVAALVVTLSPFRTARIPAGTTPHLG